MPKIKKLNCSIFIIWLFTISGIIGISSSSQDWFLENTPLNLTIYFLLILLNIKSYNYKLIVALSIPFFLGFISEGLGVNYGYIFGSYDYGENLGYKVWGVPVTICFNWVVLTVITNDLGKRFFQNTFFISIFGAFLMTLLDVIIEVSAPRFDYWEFEKGLVPIQNYMGWFGVAFLAHILYSLFKVKSNQKLSLHLLLAITVFFSIFLVL